MKLIYKPFGIVFGILAGLLSKKLFEAVWGITTQKTTWPKVLGAAVVEGVTFKVTRAAVDRAGANGFARLTGFWPGPKETEKSEAAEAVR
jgi:hypothetical protein